MRLSIKREALLEPLKAIGGVVGRGTSLPILSNVLVRARSGELTLTGTDIEVELSADAEADVDAGDSITVPARKLLDICRNLPSGATIDVSLKEGRVTVKSGRSRFTMATLPAEEFPSIEIGEQASVQVRQAELKDIIEQTRFSMAALDVRYFLNGLFLEVRHDRLRAVATDGHRLALADAVQGPSGIEEARQVIIPRKGVEILKGLLGASEYARLGFAENHISVTCSGIRMVSKLISARYPDYERVIPKGGNRVVVGTQELAAALARASILASEKYRGARLQIGPGALVVDAGADGEGAHDEVAAEYDGPQLEVGFNIDYLREALGAIATEKTELLIQDSQSGCVMRPLGAHQQQYVVMPMRI